MLKPKEIKNRLNEIYSQIPNFNCKHCHDCEGPIIWFKPEEINIRCYLKEHNMRYIQWTKEQFKKNRKKCPYLKNDRCSIYPVRPIVCRLQGTIKDLPCKYNKKILINDTKLAKIKKDMNNLLEEMNAVGRIYGTKKY